MAGDELLNEMDFKDRIRVMPDRQLSEFTAELVYENRIVSDDHEKRIKGLENQRRRTIGVTGGVSGIIGASFIAVIDYLLRRG